MWEARWTALLLFFLVFDSFTGQYQARLFNEHPDISPYHMMFMVNTFSMVFSLITLVHTHELESAVDFVVTHPAMHIHLVVFSLCSTVGQLFIFKTIKAFGPVVFAICMNTRIIAYIFLSAVVYSQDNTITGFMGLVIFCTIAYRIKPRWATRRSPWAEPTTRCPGRPAVAPTRGALGRSVSNPLAVFCRGADQRPARRRRDWSRRAAIVVEGVRSGARLPVGS